MPVTTWAELRWALVGCLRLARGDRGGLGYFDRSLDGFWRSFMSAFLSYPFFLVLLTMRVSLADWNAAGGLQIMLVETIGYVISWVAFPLLMLTVLRWIGRRHRFFDFMVPYNWCQLPQSVLFALIGLEFRNRRVERPDFADDRDRRGDRRPRLRMVHRPRRIGDERWGRDLGRARRPRPRRRDNPRRRRPLLSGYLSKALWRKGSIVPAAGGVKASPDGAVLPAGRGKSRPKDDARSACDGVKDRGKRDCDGAGRRPSRAVR